MEKIRREGEGEPAAVKGKYFALVEYERASHVRVAAGATTLNINKLNLLDYKAGTPGSVVEQRRDSLAASKTGSERWLDFGTVLTGLRALYTFSRGFVRVAGWAGPIQTEKRVPLHPSPSRHSTYSRARARDVAECCFSSPARCCDLSFEIAPCPPPRGYRAQR
jgi:hypothetical protein